LNRPSQNFVALDFFFIIYSLIEKFVKKKASNALKKINFYKKRTQNRKNQQNNLLLWIFKVNSLLQKKIENLKKKLFRILFQNFEIF
jgi:hypothetical protein